MGKIADRLTGRKKLPPEHRHNDQWCERHWAPYRGPVEGIVPNGVYASLRLMEEFLASPSVTELTDQSPEALNRAMQGEQPICCRLGDAVMDRILEEARRLGSPASAAH
jgi:hypothetical protein